MRILKIFAVLALAASILNISGCKEKEPEALPEPGDFSGLLRCLYNEVWYDNPGIKATVNIAEDGQSADISIYQIKFVPDMPVTVNVTIPGAGLNVRGSSYLISGEGIVPTMDNGTPVARYIVTGLSGELRGDKLRMSLNFGSFPTVYKAERL